jgi:N-carbamoyl-L-amino-acid hydrolase
MDTITLRESWFDSSVASAAFLAISTKRIVCQTPGLYDIRMNYSINRQRFLKSLRDQVRFGDTGDGGVSRPALSLEDQAIRKWFQSMIESDGLEYRIDGAGNQSAIWPCSNPSAKTLLLGSHLDSVRNGGRFDGVLGVLAAYEVLLTLREAHAKLPFHLEVINFTDEEGSILGLLGSLAIAGKLSQKALASPRGGRDALVEGMKRIGINDHSILAAKRDLSAIKGYVEVHIEQGTRLEESGLKIGIVPAIVGITSYRICFIGQTGHAGTTPMNKRRDAFRGAAVFSERARQLVIDRYSPGVVNFGIVSIAPGMFNIIPGRAELAMELRHGEPQRFAEMEQALIALASTVAHECCLEVEAHFIEKTAPALMSERFMQAVESAADSLKLSHTRMMSFAGHDSQSLADAVDTVMLFVPSENGVSHNPREYTSDDDCVNGANVMLQTIVALADS